MSHDDFLDPTTAPFWTGAEKRQLLIQKCPACGHAQFFPRPMCLACSRATPDWIEASGDATLYSVTTVRTQVLPELPAPYLVGLVDLDEGPRLVAGIAGTRATIGSRLRLEWRERAGLPPVPVFRPVSET